MKRVIEDSILNDIAKAIQEKNGTDTKYEDVEMAQAVRDISTSKEEQEKTINVTENGVTEILPDEGKTLSKVNVEVDVADNHCDMFWDSYQQNGNRTNYDFAYSGEGWNDVTFNPRYDITPNSFYYGFKNSKITDLRGIFAKNNVVLDTSKVLDIRGLFDSSTITHIGVVSTAGTHRSWGYQLFANCRNLIDIEEIFCSEALNDTSYKTWFSNCNSLVSVKFSGVIKGDISFSASPLLNAGSAKSALMALANFSGTENEFAYSITFHSNVWDLLDAEGETSPDGTTWKAYTDNKGWNY